MLLLDKIQLADVLYDMVEIWVAANGEHATLQKFISILEANELVQIADHIAAKFNVKIGNSPFPSGLPFYLKRTLLIRRTVSIKIFELDTPDIFLFTGMERHELSRLARNRVTGSSTEQLETVSISAKYLILDSPSHLHKIIKTTDSPIHLISKYPDGKMRWIQSIRGIENLRRNLTHYQDEFSEEDFVEMVVNSESGSPICICDSPGMGKSVLLASVQMTLLEEQPDKSVLLIPISEFIAAIAQNTTIITATAIKNVLRKFANKGRRSEINLEPDLNEGLPREMKISVELLLDGLDEVDSAQYEFALEILKTVHASFKQVRIWVTSRPHLLRDIELTLNTLGYHISPFTESDQVRFLTSYWGRVTSTPSYPERLEQFAQRCLQNLNSTLQSENHVVAGIPLQCLLIGEVFGKDALEHARADNTIHPEVQILSITELYTRLIQKKFEKCRGGNDHEHFMNAHVKLSLDLLFPGQFLALATSVGQLEEDAHLLKCGILECSGPYSLLKFIHRTFAEYFIAWYVVRRLVNEDWTEDFKEFVFEGVLKCERSENAWSPPVTFEKPVICYFLNFFLVEMKLQREPFIDQAYFSSNYETVAIACAGSNFLHLFRLLEGIYESSGFVGNRRVCKTFALTCIRYSTFEFAKIAINRSHAVGLFDPVMKVEVLQEAVRLGGFSVVEFLIKEKGLDGLVHDMDHAIALLGLCVINSRENSVSQIRDKIQIIGLLRDINPRLKQDEAWGNLLVAYAVHVQLMLKMLELEAGRYVTDEQGRTFLHLNFGRLHITPQDYHSLAVAVPENTLRRIAHMRGMDGETPLASILRRIEPLPQTLDLFKRVGADFNSVDFKGSTILSTAIQHRRETSTIEKLVQLGADVNQVDVSGLPLLAQVIKNGESADIIRVLIQSGADVGWKYGWKRKSLLHYAAKWGKWEAVGELAQWIDINGRDLLGRKPKYYAAKQGRLGEFMTGLELAKDQENRTQSGN